jgi:ferredoxin/flavodoxin---NADP+ reductase
MSEASTRQVVVIGAGPAGIYAARTIAAAGVNVVLLNRDIKPGGLAEYGIYYDKYKMKLGLRKQFRLIMDCPYIAYYGNVTVGNESGLSLQDLQELGFDAIMATVGAQGTKWLGLPGEDLKGVYHAKDIVYHYNKLPPYSTEDILVGKRVALVGAGNVMMDIAHWMVRDLKVEEVIAVVRRGPAEVKFDKKEMEMIARNIDLQALDEEFARVAPVMEAIGQDPRAAQDYILAALPKALERVSNTRFRFNFLTSPMRMIGDEDGKVQALEVEDNTLVLKDGDTKARSLGTKRLMEVETVVFAIGDKVDAQFGLPVQWNEFVKNPQPRFPVDGKSYEAFDPEAGKPVEGVFVAGWSREASSGLVGVARKDGENGSQALLQYLDTLPPSNGDPARIEKLLERIKATGRPPVTLADVKVLESYEAEEAKRLGLEDFKLKTNEEMLAVMGH